MKRIVRVALWETLTSIVVLCAACGGVQDPVVKPTRAAPASAGASASVAPPTASAAEPPAPPPAGECEPLIVAAPAIADDPIDAPIPEFVGNESVHPFYERMAMLLRGRLGTVRIGFYGDSNLTLDVISGTLRRDLQKGFGDGGHGYVGVGSPFRGYRHLDVHRRMVGHWETYLYSHHDRGEGFGAGGMAAATGERNARALFRTADESAPVGQTASRLSVFFLRQPNGGRFSISVDGERQAEVDTAAPTQALGIETTESPDGPHRFEVRNLDQKWIRLFGVTLERDAPGVVVDSFGVTGTTYHHLSRMDEAVSRAMLAARSYDLLLFLVGTNFWRFEDNPLAAARVVRMHREVRPGLPIVIMSPPDHVRSKQAKHSDPRVVQVADQLREIAGAQDCAFWDFREAMGGDGSMRTFYHRGLAGADLYHLTDRGAALMGHRLAHALVRGLGAYLTTHPRAGCG